MYSSRKKNKKKPTKRGFPSGPLVKNLPANAGDMETHRMDPRSKKIPHATDQLSPCITTTEAVL